jgi:hypothetical protein
MLVLSRLLIVGHPLIFAVRATEAMRALPIRGAPLAIALVLHALIVAIGVAAGRALGIGAPHGVRFTQVALGLSLAMDLLRYSTSIFPNNRAPGDTPFYVAATVAYHGAWLTYLARRR